MKIKTFLIGIAVVLSAIEPTGLIFAAQVQQLDPTAKPTCYNFSLNLGPGAGGNNNLQAKAEVLKLQLALVQEGFTVGVAEFGTFSTGTVLAVKKFQEKFKDEILAPVGLANGSGYVGPVTRLKLNLLYGCNEKATLSEAHNNAVRLNVSGILLDNAGISVTFCNRSSQNIPTFPVRVRLNGIVREFDIAAARTADTCYPARWDYETWGLSYSPETVFAIVVSLDPFGYYKTGELKYPDLENISIPAIDGVQLSVRHLIFKDEGVQGTFCNMGTTNLAKYPVKIIINGVSRNIDVQGAYKSGKCQSVTLPFSAWDLPSSSSTVYTAVALVDPDLFYKDAPEFNNAAAISGIP